MIWHCPICDAPTKRPIAATFDHLRPLNSPSVWKDLCVERIKLSAYELLSRS